MNSQGFAGMVPIAPRRARSPRSTASSRSSPFIWYGGKYSEEIMPFAQFGVDPDTVFTIYDELTDPARPAQGVPARTRPAASSAASSPRTGASRSATRCRSRGTSTRST